MGQYVTHLFANEPKGRYLDQYTKLCRLISLGSRRNASFIRHWTVFAMVVTTNTVLVTLMYMHIITHNKDIDRIAEIVDFATLFTAGLFRYLHAYVNRKKYDELAQFIHENFIHESVDPGKKFTMDRCVRISKLASFSYMAVVTTWLIQVVSSQVFYKWFTQKMEKPATVIVVDMPYDETTPFGKILTYAIHFGTYSSNTLIYCFIDTYWFAVLMLTTGQFELISHSIRSLTVYDEEEGEAQETDAGFTHLQQVVTSCLYHHQILKRCVRMIEQLLNPVVLVDLLHAITSITFILLDMTNAVNQQNQRKVADLLVYFLISITHMWFLDYFSNRLAAKEEDISMAIYESPWWKYPKKLRSEIVVMTILASRPLKLTGGKLFILSLEFFGRSIRTIFSYFTVLLQLRGS